LLKNIERLSSWEAQEFFEGKYSWFYYSQYEKKFEAKFLKTLKQQAWLVDKNNNFKKPAEITFSELSDNYIKENPNIDVIRSILEFKPEIIEQLPEYDRRILEIAKARNITPDELEKILSEREEKPLEQEKEQWAPECEPDSGNLNIQEVEPDKIITADLSGQAENIEVEAGESEEPTKGTEKPEKEVEKTPIDKKAIGKWGEKYVYNALRKRYQEQGEIIETNFGFKVTNTEEGEFEIIWLNKHQEKGKGYDFVIKKNASEIEYIEVKTKIEEKPELVEVTGTQWEFARKLFDQDNGERYSFYVVFNAGRENAKIIKYVNPIKLWKEGKICADPVKFKL